MHKRFDPAPANAQASGSSARFRFVTCTFQTFSESLLPAWSLRHRKRIQQLIPPQPSSNPTPSTREAIKQRPKRRWTNARAFRPSITEVPRDSLSFGNQSLRDLSAILSRMRILRLRRSAMMRILGSMLRRRAGRAVYLGLIAYRNVDLCCWRVGRPADFRYGQDATR